MCIIVDDVCMYVHICICINENVSTSAGCVCGIVFWHNLLGILFRHLWTKVGELSPQLQYVMVLYLPFLINVGLSCRLCSVWLCVHLPLES